MVTEWRSTADKCPWAADTYGDSERALRVNLDAAADIDVNAMMNIEDLVVEYIMAAG